MNKQVLSPFDCDMCAMIEDITKQEIEVTASDTSIRLSWAQNGSEGNDKAEGQRIEALKQAIRGRLGDRFIEFFYDDGRQSVYMKYDPEEYPEEMRTRLVDPDATAGTRYCRTLLEVDAIQFRRDNVDDVLRFTGGGTVTTPRTPNGKAMFSFPDGNGIFVDVPESWYIIRELNGRFTARPEKDFKREFEPKGTPAENYTEQPARPVVAQIANLFNELFGTNIASRCRKMEEEFNEYKAAVKHALPEFDDPGRMNAVIDELADLNAVVFHSAAILGITQRELLEMAYDKVKGRQTDPMYKRKHPHEKKQPPTPQEKAVDVVHGISPGLRYMVDERLEQLFLGRNVEHDNKENAAGELLDVAAALIKNDPDYFGRSGWSWDWWKKTTAKPERERLAIAGALVAAEIDREETNRVAYENEIAARNTNDKN
jgi:hypothetical protein